MRPFVASLLCAVALPFTAQAGWYGGPMLMGGFTDTSINERTPVVPLPMSEDSDTNGVSGGAGALAGYDFTNDGAPISLEFAGTYRARHDMNLTYINAANTIQYGNKSNVQSADFVLSALYDLPLGWKLQPYVGGGAGVAHIWMDNEIPGVGGSEEGSNTNFVWQAQTGVKYPLGDGMKLRFDYRYIDYGEINTGLLGTGDEFALDMVSHDLRLGITWDF